MHQVSLFIFTSCIINAEITINGYSYFFFSFHLHSFALGGVVVVVVVVVVIVVVPPVDVGGGWKVYGQHPIQRGTHQEKIFFELSADDVSKFQISVSPSSITIRTTTTTITTYIYICFYANSTQL